jgi:hypothetical protein
MVAIAASTLTACSEQQSVQEVAVVEQTTTAETSGMMSVDLSEHGLPAELMVPDKSKTGVDPTITVDDVTSIVNIRCGKNYNVMMREEDMSMDLIKSDLEGDIMFTNDIILETDNSIVYKQTTPDGSNELYHFASVIDDGTSIVFARSFDMGQYSKLQAERMMKSAMTLKMMNPLAAN